MKEVYIGSIIRKRRQELGLTQEQLCRGICETVTLSRIENGKQTPSRSKLNALLQRLGMPGERYYALLSEQEMKISNLQTEIVSCNVLGQREQGLKKLDELEQQGKVFVIAPETTLGVGRTESDPKKLRELYEEGYRIGREKMKKLRKYLECQDL